MHTINPLSAPFSTSERTQQSPTIQVPRIRYSTSSGKQQSQSTAQFKPQFDQVICEEPLQITLAWVTNDQGKEQQEHSQVFTITMRTPGDDVALITGLLFTEGASSVDNFRDYNPFKIQRSAGVGVRLFMPAFGLLGIDFGHGFDPIPGETIKSGWQTHFIIGQQF